LKSLGLKAVLPPPEEKQQVKSAAGAARAASRRWSSFAPLWLKATAILATAVLIALDLALPVFLLM
jgi:hypothetical protein